MPIYTIYIFLPQIQNKHTLKTALRDLKEFISFYTNLRSSWPSGKILKRMAKNSSLNFSTCSHSLCEYLLWYRFLGKNFWAYSYSPYGSNNAGGSCKRKREITLIRISCEKMNTKFYSHIQLTVAKAFLL